ncbi:MerR family transcriptional regulator, partial [Streptomyces benahoarensis]
MAANENPNDQHKQREFRMAELAAEAGITVRTLRFYRERKLIPPPRREGRIAWYNEHHLARLRSISALLERGHTLGGITELLAAFESGRDVGELLGLDATFVTPWSDETPVRLTPEELADHYSGDVTAENLAASLDIGYLAVDGDEFVHTSRRRAARAVSPGTTSTTSPGSAPSPPSWSAATPSAASPNSSPP